MADKAEGANRTITEDHERQRSEPTIIVNGVSLREMMCLTVFDVEGPAVGDFKISAAGAPLKLLPTAYNLLP